jgi:hypothetical protein
VPFCTRMQLRMVMPTSGYSNCADSANGFEKVERAGIAFVFKVRALGSGLKDARGFLSLLKITLWITTAIHLDTPNIKT